MAEVLSRLELPQQLSADGWKEQELEQIRQIGKEGIVELSTALDSPDRKLRLKSAWALGRLGPIATNAMPALSAAVSNSEPGVRYLAIKTLMSFQVYDEKLVPSLLNCLGDKSPMVCVAAGDLLNEFEGQRRSMGLAEIDRNQAEYVLAFLKSPSVRVQLMGLERTAAIERPGARLLGVVKSLQTSASPPVRTKAASILASLEHAHEPQHP